MAEGLTGGRSMRAKVSVFHGSDMNGAFCDAFEMELTIPVGAETGSTVAELDSSSECGDGWWTHSEGS